MDAINWDLCLPAPQGGTLHPEAIMIGSHSSRHDSQIFAFLAVVADSYGPECFDLTWKRVDTRCSACMLLPSPNSQLATRVLSGGPSDKIAVLS